jgi:pimeloyl-ACP methyl ester carboxylesterase
MDTDGFRLRPAEVGGYRGWYTVTGGGPPAVLLASPLALAATYRPTARRLGRSHRVHTVQMPGSGRGSRVPRWGVAEYAGWAAGFLDRLGLDDVTLIGHSYTGAVAAAVAALDPGRVGRLVIADSVGAIRDSLPRMVAGQLVDFLAIEVGLALRAWHHLAFNAVFHTRTFVRLVRESLRPVAVPYLARVAVPALVVWGGRDHTTPPRCAAVFTRLLPDADLHVSPRGAHGWAIDRADEFAAAIERFTGAAPRGPVEEYADA